MADRASGLQGWLPLRNVAGLKGGETPGEGLGEMDRGKNLIFTEIAENMITLR